VGADGAMHGSEYLLPKTPTVESCFLGAEGPGASASQGSGLRPRGTLAMSYLNGRFGALPVLGAIESRVDEDETEAPVEKNKGGKKGAEWHCVDRRPADSSGRRSGMRKRPAKLPTLLVENFAQIERAELAFGDLTVLVGAQGTGKSLVLQWLKTALDGPQIVKALRDSGQGVETAPVLVDLVFGVGMMSAWREGESAITWEGKPIDLAQSLMAGRSPSKRSPRRPPLLRASLASDCSTC